MSETEVHDEVSRAYTEALRRSRGNPGTGCCGADAACCAPSGVAALAGYGEEREKYAEAAASSFGCGNPLAFAGVEPGQTVLDLGSGAGLDLLVAAEKVGPTGKVIGVDMTDAMLDKARENAKKVDLQNSVEFRKGHIEDLPIEDESVDVIISNCVINLSPEKERVYAEAYRVLKPGGRLMISDIVLERPLPQAVIDSIDAYLGCVGGASLRAEYLDTIAKAGFREIRIDREASFLGAISLDDPRVQEVMERMQIDAEEVKSFASAVTSLQISAVK